METNKDVSTRGEGQTYDHTLSFCAFHLFMRLHFLSERLS